MSKKQIPRTGGGPSYAERMQAKRQMENRERVASAVQWTMDAATIAVNETFHRRGEKVWEFLDNMNAVMGEIADISLADERDLTYAKAKVDERLKYILGERFQSWEERY